MSSWTESKVQDYRVQAGVPALHFLLDMSGSMLEHQKPLLTAYNQTIVFLRTLLPPLTSTETWGFSEISLRIHAGLLGTLPPLTKAEYRPEGSTWLLASLCRLLQETTAPGQHILVVFTDGLDTEYPWIQDEAMQAHRAHVLAPVTTLMQQRQEAGWLCVYLGAFPQALRQGLACGFSEGNCLVFASYALAEAFQRLREGMQRFITANAPERKLLVDTGIFTEER